MIIIRTPKVLLRDIEIQDEDAILRWQTSGEWRYLDAPWDGILHALSPKQEKALRDRLREARQKPLPTPRKTAVISLPAGTPIGFVNRYGDDRFPEVYYLGINICDDEYLEQGLGSAALHAWIDYLFENSSAHKLEAHTWSLNPRMMHVAEKLGFKHEGTERELIEWQGIRQDRVRYGLLRSEWQSARSKQ